MCEARRFYFKAERKSIEIRRVGSCEVKAPVCAGEPRRLRIVSSQALHLVFWSLLICIVRNSVLMHLKRTAARFGSQVRTAGVLYHLVHLQNIRFGKGVPG